MGLKLPEKSRQVITERQQKFVENITNINSDTYCDVIKSCTAAGYSEKGNPVQRAVKVLASKTVLKLLMEHSSHLNRMEFIREEMTREKFQQELYIFLQACKDSEDRTNWKGALELFGKFQQFLTERHLLTTERAEEMTDEQARELLELSKYRHLRSGSIIDAQLTEPALLENVDNMRPEDIQGIDAGFIQGCSDVVSRETGIPDVVGDDDKADNTSTSTVHNDAQVIDNT
jgi:hypothetical protein